VPYQCQYFTINSGISECNYKWGTWNAEQEIGPDGSGWTGQNLQVDGYGSGIGPPRDCGAGFWTGLKPYPPVSVIHTWTTGRLPGHVANTCHQPFWRIWIPNISLYNEPYCLDLVRQTFGSRQGWNSILVARGSDSFQLANRTDIQMPDYLIETLIF